jgi:hypothetical protein
MFDLAVRLQPYTSNIYTPIEYKLGMLRQGCGLTIHQGKAKYNKWKDVVDAGTSQQEADDKYVELGEQLLAKHDV